jgi:hypothetical protein
MVRIKDVYKDVQEDEGNCASFSRGDALQFEFHYTRRRLT